MRNLKRVLSLALALVMVLGMMVIGTSAATFTDADEITYTEAVDVMSGLGVFKGDNGALKPTEVLTRKEAAVIVARIILGEKMAENLTATKQLFADVPVDEWYAAEVEYCNNIGMIQGYTANGEQVFNPDGKLTGTAFAKLLLCAMGYDAAAQGYTGDKWDTNINADALRNGLNIKGVDIKAELTREGAAQMLFNALYCEMVKYDTAYDYSTGAAILVGPKDGEGTFQSNYFKGLTKVRGIVDAVDMYYGSTTFFTGLDELTKEPIKVEVRKSGADFNNIGFAGYVWALPGSTETDSYLTAISDVIIAGTSMGDNTNGAKIDDLTDDEHPAYIGYIDESGCDVFRNGYYQGTITLDKYYNVVYEPETKAAVKDALDKAGDIGVKVEFIDNDNKGKAEAIVITDYTFAQVTRVVKQSKSGVVTVKYYELTKMNDDKAEVEIVYPSELEYVDELNRGDFVTYVAYDKEYYTKDLNEWDSYFVNVLDVAQGEFESITRTKLYNDPNYNVKVYNIDGEGYLKSELSYNGYTAHLNAGTINDEVVYVLDQYGHIVFACAPAADPDSFLYVFDNEHDSVLTGLAETLVAYTDGTVEIVDVKKDVVDSALADKVFTYEVKGGAHILGNADYVPLTDVNYETYEVSMDGIDDLTYTTIVDLRDVFAGNAEDGTVYVGYTEIPSFLGGTLLYIPEIDLAFLTKGTAPTAAADGSASFVVFNTKTNIVDRILLGYDDNGKPVYKYTYELEAGVLVDGELVPNFVLTGYQKAMVDTFGVGAYTFGKDGALKAYTSFAEDSVKWTPEDNGTVIINNVDVTAAGTFDDIIVLDISEGEIGEWDQLVLPGYYYSYIDGKILYIVGDNTVNSSILAWAGKAGTGAVCGANEYWAYTGKVTNYAVAPVVTYTVNDVMKYAEGATASVEAANGAYVAVKNAATGEIVKYAEVKKGVASFTMPACNVVTEDGYYNYFLNGTEKFTNKVGFQNQPAWAGLADLAGTVAADTFVKVEWTDEKGVAKSATFAAADVAATPIDVVNYVESITTNWVSVTGVEEEVFYVQIGDKITYTNPLTDYAVDVTVVGTDIKSARVNVGDSLTLVVEGNVEVTAVPFCAE